MLEAVFFYIFATLMVFSAIGVVSGRQPIYCVLSLLVVMVCMAVLFVMLGAYFLAAVQLLLYAGAVLVLFLFVLMLLNLSPDALARVKAFRWPAIGMLIGGAFLWLLRQRLVALDRAEPALQDLAAAEGTIEAIGRTLFERYLLPFELVSFLILAAVIGAVTLAKQDGADHE